jgi:phosphotransferase system HPr-like phosphotransfer protein
MPLPSLEKITPVFDITIPSTNETLKFRPFLVKEEKILLIALEGNDEKAMLESIVQVVEACAISPIKVDALANFDLEYIFLQLRARSVSEVVELSYRCHNEVPLTAEEAERRAQITKLTNKEFSDTMSCDNIVKISLMLDAVQVQSNPEHTKTIFLSDSMGLNMRYPNFAMAKKMLSSPKKAKTGGSDITDALQSIAMCIESVFDDQSVYSNFQLKEISEWIEKLTQTQFAKIQEFFETMPKLAHDIEFYCPKCGYKESQHIEGLPNFFG